MPLLLPPPFLLSRSHKEHELSSNAELLEIPSPCLPSPIAPLTQREPGLGWSPRRRDGSVTGFFPGGDGGTEEGQRHQTGEVKQI